MQKKILCICTLLTASLIAMEKESKIPLQLTHHSPEITRVHSPEYLRWLEKLANSNNINNRNFDVRTYEQYKKNLKDVTNVLNATDDLIEGNKSYTVSIVSHSSSMIGNTGLIWGKHCYATIPIAAAHALTKNLCKRILIIDENLTQDPHCVVAKDYEDDKDYYKDACRDIKDSNKLYYKRGNGSLLYPNQAKQPELFNIFNNKVMTYDKIYPQSLWNFLTNDGKDIDLIFYNIDTDVTQYTERKPHIFSLLQKRIPTVFIFSQGTGFSFKKSQNSAIIEYIHAITDRMSYIPFFMNDVLYNTSNLMSNNDNGNASSSDSISSEYNDSSPDESSDSSSTTSDSSSADSKSFDLDPFVFKITTDVADIDTYDGANQILLAKDITITKDGVMEVTLGSYYELCSDYKRYDDSTSTSSNDDDQNTNNSNESSSADTIQKTNFLTHQSSEITCIHTPEYLEWLTNDHTAQELAAGLTWVARTLNATNAIELQVASNERAHNKPDQPIYNICVIPDSFYAAGNNVNPRFGDLYAIIPIAAAYALQSGLFEKIIIIEEHIDAPSRNEWTINMTEYAHQENGSIFHADQKNKLFDLFNNKILIQQNDKIIDTYRSTTQVFFSRYPNINIDLAFYNVNEDSQDCDQRKQTITALLEKNIPIVFICTSQSIADDIQNIIDQCTKHSNEKGIACKNKFYM